MKHVRFCGKQREFSACCTNLQNWRFFGKKLLSSLGKIWGMCDSSVRYRYFTQFGAFCFHDYALCLQLDLLGAEVWGVRRPRTACVPDHRRMLLLQVLRWRPISSKFLCHPHKQREITAFDCATTRKNQYVPATKKTAEDKADSLLFQLRSHCPTRRFWQQRTFIAMKNSSSAQNHCRNLRPQNILASGCWLDEWQTYQRLRTQKLIKQTNLVPRPYTKIFAAGCF